MSNADSMFNSYMRRTGQLPIDGVQQFQHTFLRDTLRRLEVAMQDEQVPPETITRVMRAVLYGAPGEAEAEMRVKQQERLTKATMEQPLLRGGSTP